MNSVIILGGLGLFAIFGVVYFYAVQRQHFFKAKGPKNRKHNKSLSGEQLQPDIVLNSMQDGVIVVDTNLNIQLFNPAVSMMTGWKQEEALDLPLNSIIHLVNKKDETYTDAENPFALVIKNSKTVRDNDAVLLSRSNKNIGVTINASPLYGKKEEITGVVAIISDVSKQRDAERQHDEFISTASHEMRSPVAAIEGYISLAMNENVSKIDSKAREFLEKAHASTEQLGGLFQDLLTSSKAEDGRLPNHPEIVEMSSYLEKIVEDLRFNAQKKNLTVDFVVGTEESKSKTRFKIVSPLYYVNVDPDRIREVISNLFNNAVKYTDVGKITVGLTGDNGIVQLYIKDTGPGIPAEDIPHLFQKFYRVDNSVTRQIGGSGLGLFISRKIVELYDGRIWAESEPGSGSKFFINLPRVPSEQVVTKKSKEDEHKLAHPIKPILGQAN